MTRTKMILASLICALSLSLPLQGKAAPSGTLDEAAEKRLVAISSELRCLVCQNESLAGSQAELAGDLRREIGTMIQQGKSDQEIIGELFVALRKLYQTEGGTVPEPILNRMNVFEVQAPTPRHGGGGGRQRW